jgi:hypothetical protein
MLDAWFVRHGVDTGFGIQEVRAVHEGLGYPCRTRSSFKSLISNRHYRICHCCL